MDRSGLSSGLEPAFWDYARMALPDQRLDRLARACQNEGLAGGGASGPRAGTRPQALCGVLRVAAASEGKRFVRRAGYFAGSQAARRFVQASAHPSQSATRMATNLATAAPGATLSARVLTGGALEVRVASARPLGAHLVEYAGGFLKGVAVRLNEGEPPLIRARLEAAGRAWTATVDFGKPAPVPYAKGGRKKPRQ